MGRALISVVLILAVACGEATGTAEQSSTTAASVSTARIGTTDSPLGPILVDAEGMTLYSFASDDGESTCYDACADLWPPAETGLGLEEGLDLVALGATVRTDGTEQLTVNGRPVYLYAGDAAPGDVQGHGIGGVWFAFGADGEPILEDTGTPTTTIPSAPDDYGY